jgi:hypothetical protein
VRLACQREPFLHIVIAGTTKAATTSLFDYLGAHPQVCASRAKESRFFLDPGYPVAPRPLHIERDGPEGYARLFDACPERPFRLEATPDYLYDPASAELLRRHLDDVRIVMVLRDPIARLGSWYRFARQNDDLASDLPFDRYVARQLDGDVPNNGQPWRALDQGRYLHHLGPFLERFDRSELFLIDYGALVGNVRSGVQTLCRWIGLPGTFYDRFDFSVSNRTRSVRSSGLHRRYRALRRGLRRTLGNVPGVGAALRKVGRSAEPLYHALNRGADEAVPELPPELRRRLEQRYRRELTWLGRGALRLEAPTPGLE